MPDRKPKKLPEFDKPPVAVPVAEHPLLDLIRVPEGMEVEMILNSPSGTIPADVKEAFEELGYTLVEQATPVETKATEPPVDPVVAAKAEADIAAGKIAQLEGEEDQLVWVGDKGWPVFIGYPYLSNLGALPWPLLKVREDAATHCTVFVRK